MSQVNHATIPPHSPPQSLREITATLPPIVSAVDEPSSMQPPHLTTLQPQSQTHTPAHNTAATTDLQRPEPALLPPPAAEDEDVSYGVAPATSSVVTPSAAVHITLLLTTGARHPFTIDQKYLKKRHVGATAEQQEELDPFEISVYTLKELIWKDWRDGEIRPMRRIGTYELTLDSIEWEPRPTTPASIRLIHFGKLLDDKMSLKGMSESCIYLTNMAPPDIQQQQANNALHY